MTESPQRISELPLETQAQIRSSVQISSLCDVVLELVKNSLDANARNIKIHLDFLKGYCSVLDNGHGIPQCEFLEGKLGRLYHTSKATHRHAHGRYGRYLAFLSGVSLLSITSCSSSEANVTSKVLRDGKQIAMETNTTDDELGGLRHGTRVTVHNLFGQMPVRVKHRHSRLEKQWEHEKEFMEIKHTLVGLVLATPRQFSLNMRETSHKYTHKPQISLGDTNDRFDMAYIASTLLQAGFLDSLDLSSWRRISVRSSTLAVCAAICLQPVPSQYFQFISLNDCPIPSSVSKHLLHQINAIFNMSDFGNVEDDDSGCDSKLRTRTSLKRVTGNIRVDSQPMFYIRIETMDEIRRLEEPTETDADRLVTTINAVLQSLTTEFLQSNGFALGKSATAGRNRRQAKTSSVANVSNFSNWTRVKSGTDGPQDILNGLPFMPQRSAANASSVQQQPMSSKFSSEETAIEWTNPQTRNTLRINPRTGIVLPYKPMSMSSIPKLQRPFRALDDVMNTLKQYAPRNHTEEALRSVVPDDESSYHFSSNRHVCTLSDGMPMQISGPTSVELEEVHITKCNLKTASILGQVDGKFVLASVVSEEDETVLIMIDQHAADERVKLEELLERFSRGGTTSLSTPIVFEVGSHEARRFEHLRAYFARLAILYSVPKCQVRVSALPELIVERCRAEPKLLIDLLRTEVWRDHSPSLPKPDHWANHVSAYPQGVLRMLVSRACRSAIMFNDKLSLEQCSILVQQLSECLFPFQCAHGRPSLTTLARIRDVGISDEMEMKESSFGQGWKAWAA